MVRLGDKKVVGLNAELACIGYIQCVFRINESANATGALGFRNDVQGKSGLPGRFWSIDFNDTSAGKASDSQGQVHAERTCGDDIDFVSNAFIQTHNRAFAISLFDFDESGFQSLGVFATSCHGLFSGC